MRLRRSGLAQGYMRAIRLGQDILCALSHILRRPSLVALNRSLKISKARIMKNPQKAIRNMAAIAIGPVRARRRVSFAGGIVFLARGLVFLARGLVLLASALVVAGPAMSADSRLSAAQYREAVNDANSSYQGRLLQCKSTSADERSACRREARAARTEALAAAKAQRASGTDKSVDPSKPPKPETPSGSKASKTDIQPQLQRDSPPDIVPPKNK
jgi:hypothetical protein